VASLAEMIDCALATPINKALQRGNVVGLT